MTYKFSSVSASWPTINDMRTGVCRIRLRVPTLEGTIPGGFGGKSGGLSSVGGSSVGFASALSGFGGLGGYTVGIFSADDESVS